MTDSTTAPGSQTAPHLGPQSLEKDSATDSTTDSGAREQIIALESEWAGCLLRGDFARLDELQVEGFSLISQNGDIVGKKDLHEILRTKQLEFFEIKILELNVQIFGDSALVIGTWQMSTKFFEARFSGKSVFTAMWVKQNDQWKSACVHSTDARLIDSWKSLSPRRV